LGLVDQLGFQLFPFLVLGFIRLFEVYALLRCLLVGLDMGLSNLTYFNFTTPWLKNLYINWSPLSLWAPPPPKGDHMWQLLVLIGLFLVFLGLFLRQLCVVLRWSLS